MSLNSAAVDLSNAVKAVQEAWEEIREGWDDLVARELQEHTLEPLERHTTGVLNAMDRLAPILAKALRDVS